MGWDERLFDLLDDLEGQAEALYAAERDAELADRSRAEYAAVTLAGRLMASVGRDVLLDVDGTGPVRGELRRVGTGWCLVSGDAGDWLVPLGAIMAAQGVSDRAVPEVAWSAEVVLTRVGKDFVEAETAADPGQRLLVALTSIGAVQSREPG